MKGKEYSFAASKIPLLNTTIKAVLDDVKPSKEDMERYKFAINEMMGRLKKRAPKEVEILLAGSAARGTQLKGNSDIDIFLLFPRTMEESKIEQKGLKIGKDVVDRKRGESLMVKYAEHPFSRVMQKSSGVNFDIVPAYKITNASERGTAVDRTQLHNEFVNSRLTERQRDDVRILKAFLKAHKIYGAEARIEGFSGYLCELLVYYYGSFTGVVEKMANAELPVCLEFGKKNREAFDWVKIFNSRFVVIDPTDSKRNVAANVSEESFFRLVLASRLLIGLPSKKTFYGKGTASTYSERKLGRIAKDLGSDLYVIHFKVPDIANEIIWQQLKKFRLRLDELVKKAGFEPIISLQHVDGTDALMGIFVHKGEMRAIKVMGPEVGMTEAAERFVDAHRKSALIFIERDRVYAIEKPQYRNPEALIRAALKGRQEKLPSYLKPKRSSLHINRIPEKYAKQIYYAYIDRFAL